MGFFKKIYKTAETYWLKEKVENLEKRIKKLQEDILTITKLQTILADTFTAHVTKTSVVMKNLAVFINTLNIRHKIDHLKAKDVTDSVINLDESMKHLNSKVDFFTENKE